MMTIGASWPPRFIEAAPAVAAKEDPSPAVICELDDDYVSPSESASSRSETTQAPSLVPLTYGMFQHNYQTLNLRQLQALVAVVFDFQLQQAAKAGSEAMASTLDPKLFFTPFIACNEFDHLFKGVLVGARTEETSLQVTQAFCHRGVVRRKYFKTSDLCVSDKPCEEMISSLLARLAAHHQRPGESVQVTPYTTMATYQTLCVLNDIYTFGVVKALSLYESTLGPMGADFHRRAEALQALPKSWSDWWSELCQEAEYQFLSALQKLRYYLGIENFGGDMREERAAMRRSYLQERCVD